MNRLDKTDAIAAIARKFGLALMLQFGSTVETPSYKHQESDIDIGILASKSLQQRELIDLQYALAKCFGVFEDAIDIVELHSANSLIVYQAVTNGKVIHDSDGHQFNKLYVAAMRQFIDEAPLYQLEADSLTRKVKSYDR